MPIKDLSDTVRIPRLGKIHLGYRHEKGYPVATDYFVLPKDHPDLKALVAAFGEKPKELHILIPLEDEETWASQYYRAYNQTYGLVCKGDGENALRMTDPSTGGLPGKQTPGAVEMNKIDCCGKDCPEYQAGKCHEVMNLRFILPEIPGIGVWQIDTGSINSILNINSCASVIKRAFGRIAMIPLNLTLEPAIVNNPDDGKKKTVHVLNLRTTVTMVQLAAAARDQSKQFQIEGPDLAAIYDERVQQDIEDLWPEDNATKNAQIVVMKPEFMSAEYQEELRQKAIWRGIDAAIKGKATGLKTGVTSPPGQGTRKANQAPPTHRAPRAIISPAGAKTGEGSAATGSHPATGKTPAETEHVLETKGDKTISSEKVAPGAAPPWASVTEKDVPDLNACFRQCYKYFKTDKGQPMQPVDVVKELGYTAQLDITESGWQCWQKIAAARR